MLFSLSPGSTCIRLIVTSSWSSLCLFTATSSPIRSCSSLRAISASSSALKHVFKVHKYKAWHLIHVYRSFKAKYSWENLLDICWSNCNAAVPFNGSGKKNSSYHTNTNKYVLSMKKSKIKLKTNHEKTWRTVKYKSHTMCSNTTPVTYWTFRACNSWYLSSCCCLSSSLCTTRATGISSRTVLLLNLFKP